jgi:hypothetical protein
VHQRSGLLRDPRHFRDRLNRSRFVVGKHHRNQATPSRRHEQLSQRVEVD